MWGILPMEDGTGITVRSSLGSARAIPLRRYFLGCKETAVVLSQTGAQLGRSLCDAWCQETLCGLGVVT